MCCVLCKCLYVYEIFIWIFIFLENFFFIFFFRKVKSIKKREQIIKFKASNAKRDLPFEFSSNWSVFLLLNYLDCDRDENLSTFITSPFSFRGARLFRTCPLLNQPFFVQISSLSFVTLSIRFLHAFPCTLFRLALFSVLPIYSSIIIR